MEDALAFGGACISLLNHADRVKAGCLAQLVNVIAPIMTETGGPAWRQTIFHPFAQWSNWGRGRVLRAAVHSPTYAARYYDPRGPQELYYDLPSVPYLKLAAVHDEDGGTLTVFALNRNLREDITLDLTASGFGVLQVAEATQLRHDDLKATNNKAEPNRVSPAPLDGVRAAGERVLAELKPASWNVIRLSHGAAGGLSG